MAILDLESGPEKKVQGKLTLFRANTHRQDPAPVDFLWATAPQSVLDRKGREESGSGFLPHGLQNRLPTIKSCGISARCALSPFVEPLLPTRLPVRWTVLSVSGGDVGNPPEQSWNKGHVSFTRLSRLLCFFMVTHLLGHIQFWKTQHDLPTLQVAWGIK